MRITGKDNEYFYHGSIMWLPKLNELGIPVPKILKHGQYADVFYALISFINGKDLGEVYHTLNDSQKHDIARELTIIQKKVATLPKENHVYCYPDNDKWIARSHENIKQNKIFDLNICDKVKEVLVTYNDYFLKIQPVAFLDDISTKNVLIFDGKLSGIIDIDEMGYGDPLSVVGLTNMALLAMEADTKYIDYWLVEMNANEEQKKVVTLYTLLFCIDFMGEQGQRFANDKIVPVNQKKIELLNSIYNKLINIV